MLEFLIKFSLKNKLIILLFTFSIVGFGLYSLTQISIGAVPDVTNNQIQVISTSKNLATQDVEKFITYPVELEMANLPGVKEIRSVSKFGLSVVTVVFKDNMGTYLPRQLLAEKLKTAADKIPQGYGSPEMGPITTGLGEVYQYTVEVREPFKGQYSITELRTIQDWIIKRQLSGIPGVVEVNTWGGFLKQYEVAVNDEKLKSLNITIADVYKALESNNNVAGGGYIEKNNQAYFVRGEGLLKSIDDINKIVVANNSGVPVSIKDIAQVQMGSAPRFGAITGNGEGEKVLGQIMMIKDGNSKKTLAAIHQRIKEIEKSFPEGVYINGFLDRSELIDKTTFTIQENLILGSLIVIFIVVLLLGSWRSGLVVASVIPLSLLFTISMMNLFNIDANLMSLGAIDFGIIIDGAVIIVEYVALKITQNSQVLKGLSKIERQDKVDQITFKSSNKMMNSAIFGQLIILIVFIPILSLQGVEGKMFTPMALAFSFALIGAMILCFTYVPVIASMVLKETPENPRNISVRIMTFLTKMYVPTITWALDHKKKVIGAAFVVFLSAIFLFSRMGGEFVPTLDEGDFVIQPVLKTGTSLSKTIEITTQIEKILLENFSEVDQVVSRIGAAEIPTDPMSMEESDVIIKLKPKGEWVNAKSKDELADKFKEALMVIPGIDVEFTQPIEMRFNELITGVRSDVAVKIFGEDLDVLYAKSNEIKSLIENVEGASDVTIEKISGLPQMSVVFKRDKIAQYGLNVSDVNQMITSGFSGQTFGTVFEGEKQFDLVMRLNNTQRNDINDLKNLWIDTPTAGKIPLSELSEITYSTGPAKISRDNTRRRVVIGINVRNRDMQSVVDDIQKIIETKVEIPSGYSVAYGGQFENLKSAKARLTIALPIALLLIFILLHFAFKSLKEALMVYSAIPLAAVGGVYLLWLRGLPFSISAGVGFIALFGIAVLNGIVLIEHFKELKEHGIDDINERIIRGTKERLRPVILTAAAAALGFLPMAISTNAGAEVQRPLATVVIGGLITATFLTMVVLPVLYAIFDSKTFKIKRKVKPLSILILIFGLGSLSIQAQQPQDELNYLINIAHQNNLELQMSTMQVEKAHLEMQSAVQFEKSNVYFNQDQNNLASNDKPLNVFGIEQRFLFPTTYANQRKLKKNEWEQAGYEREILQKKIAKEVSDLYIQLVYLKHQKMVHNQLDSLYTLFSKGESLKFEVGESNYLQKITAISKSQQIKIQLQNTDLEITKTLESLKLLIQNDTLKIKANEFEKLTLNNLSYSNSLIKKTNELSEKSSEMQWKQTKQAWLPDFNASYFQGINDGLSQSLSGFQVGVEIPLLFFGKSKQTQAAKVKYEMAQIQSLQNEKQWNSEYLKLWKEFENTAQTLEILTHQKTSFAPEILKFAEMGFKNGDLDFFDYLQSIENAQNIELNYLKTLFDYNNTILKINYLY